VAALERGRAFARLAGWRVVGATGADAPRWLHDLVTADVAGLPAGRARRSLVLTPTGRIRADVTIAANGDGFVLLQAPDQPEPVDAILAPYVLSSDVVLDDRSGSVAVFAVLGDPGAEDGATVSTPSVLGPGATVVVPVDDTEAERRRLLTSGLTEVGPEALETWRVRTGRARLGADFASGSLPSEAGLEATIDFSKGCFLGQESVAKVRNLGHPPTVLVHVRADVALSPSDPVLADGARVGEVTSVATAEDATHAIVRIRWDAVGRALASEAGPLYLLQHS
jgi:folate-binding protein YgfZ